MGELLVTTAGLPGRVWEAGEGIWMVEVPYIDVITRGKTKEDALLLICDVIEMLVNVGGFKLKVYDVKDGTFMVRTVDEKHMDLFQNWGEKRAAERKKDE